MLRSKINNLTWNGLGRRLEVGRHPLITYTYADNYDTNFFITRSGYAKSD
jgi:hypothetical protein